MAVYDLSGASLSTVKGLSGDTLTQAYDINGAQLLPNLTVMTYNYQWCYKINSQLTMQQAIIDKYNADIIGLQEACTRQNVIDKVTVGSFPTIANTFLSGYTYKELSTEATNKNAIASKIALSSYQNIKYTENDDENWDYQKCYITVNGKTVAWYNTHLTWRDDQETLLRKYNQMSELYNDVITEEYAIITADFNFYGLTASGTEYDNMYKPFADLGYKLANVNVGVAPTMTFSLSTTATSLSQLSTCPDNIIVSPNIDIVNVVFDTTKFNYLNGDPIDHVAVITYLYV